MIVVFGSCQSEPKPSTPVPAIADTVSVVESVEVIPDSLKPPPPTPWMNVRYGMMMGQEMDIYLPKNGNQFPTAAVILVHGGGWRAGDKKDARGLAEWLRDNFENDLVVNVNYRLAQNGITAVPDQLNDLEAAIDFLNSKGMFHLKQIVFNGGSAGGYLAMQYSLTRDKGKLISGVVCGSGIYDLSSAEFKKHPVYDLFISLILGKDTQSVTDEELKSNSPLFNIHKDAPPMLFFSGKQDELFPGTEVRLLDSAFKSVNVEHIAIEFGMERHGLSIQKNMDYVSGLVKVFTLRHSTWFFEHRSVPCLVR